jgi:hypothetical protein
MCDLKRTERDTPFDAEEERRVNAASQPDLIQARASTLDPAPKGGDRLHVARGRNDASVGRRPGAGFVHDMLRRARSKAEAQDSRAGQRRRRERTDCSRAAAVKAEAQDGSVGGGRRRERTDGAVLPPQK